jgi:hypothetical protein
MTRILVGPDGTANDPDQLREMLHETTTIMLEVIDTPAVQVALGPLAYMTLRQNLVRLHNLSCPHRSAFPPEVLEGERQLNALVGDEFVPNYPVPSPEGAVGPPPFDLSDIPGLADL